MCWVLERHMGLERTGPNDYVLGLIARRCVVACDPWGSCDPLNRQLMPKEEDTA